MYNKNGIVLFPNGNNFRHYNGTNLGDRGDERRGMSSPISMNSKKPLKLPRQIPKNLNNRSKKLLEREILTGISAKTKEEQEILDWKRMKKFSNFIDNPVTGVYEFLRSPASAVDKFFDGRVNAEVARKKMKANRMSGKNKIMGGASRKTRKKRKTRKQKLEKRKQTKNSHYIQ
jgi:hypothetical protein